jgi:hypothetical protein
MAAQGLAVAEISLSSQVSLAEGRVVPIRSAGPGPGWCAVFLGNVVVEHKAQTHNGCFSLVSSLECAV